MVFIKKIFCLFLSILIFLTVFSTVPTISSAADLDCLIFEASNNYESYYVKKCDKNALGEVVIPSVYNGKPVTNIGNTAFYGCENVTSITIPDSVTSIGEKAFYNCKSLTSINLPEGLTELNNMIFYYCENLSSITIPENVTSIGEYVFYYCKNLISITLPESVTNIGEGAFFWCSGLTSFTIPDNVTRIADYAFCDCNNLTSITIPNGVTSIGEYAFCSCKSLTTITLPDSLTTIGDRAFFTCENLITINIPNGVTIIGESAFRYCDNLASVTLPDTLTNISDYAFCSCRKLESVILGKGVTTIGEYAFFFCGNLKYVYYTGSENLWSDITIKSQNEPLTNLPIHYESIEHSPVTDPEVSPTCTLPGKTEGSHCSVCNEILIPQEIISATGHTPGSWIIEKEATCIETGSIHKECSVCREILETAEVPITDHTIEIDAATLPTCTKVGKTEGSHCSVCNEILIPQEIVSATGHTPGSWIVEKEATCTETGSMHKYCSVCGETLESAEILVKGHKETIDTAVNPTCTEAGKTEGTHCSVCNEILLPQEIIPATGHIAGEWITDKISTTTAEGSKHKACIQCHENLETAKIKQLKCDKPRLGRVTNIATGVKFSWNKVTGTDNYEIYRKAGKGKWTKIATVKGSVTTYTDKTAKSGTTYKYTVKAKNEAGLSKYNTTGLSIKCLADPVLKAPTSAKAGITLKWSKVTGAQGYVVYRQTGNGKLTKLAIVKGATKVSYVDKSAKKGTKYTYKLLAYSGKTYSAYSNAKTITDKY